MSQYTLDRYSHWWMVPWSYISNRRIPYKIFYVQGFLALGGRWGAKIEKFQNFKIFSPRIFGFSITGNSPVAEFRKFPEF